jgi:DNA-3-methyladenine glycosylase II
VNGTAQEIIRQSAAPVKWMPAGSHHRAIVDNRLVIATPTGIMEIDGSQSSAFLDLSVAHVQFTDPVIAGLSERFPELRPLTDGGLWEGLFTSITGQAVSLHSASAFQRRLCEMLGTHWQSHNRRFWALPAADAVAATSLERIRSVGLTTKRAQGLIDVAREVVAGNISVPRAAEADGWMRELTALPMVGPWTAASSLLWGVGHVDVYPRGDVALLRAAKFAYNDHGLTMTDLDRLSECWRPQRAIAARLLWTNLLGAAWDSE